jgi:FtsZ-interacting cell division protein YlmF
MVKNDSSASKEPHFGPAIDDVTMQSMEAGASSKQRGIDRRVVLMVMARDSEVLAKFSIDEPEAFEEMRKTVERFKSHARALLDVAESASLRMSIADCRESTRH